MRRKAPKANQRIVRFDDPEIVLEKACQDERANWLAARLGLPTIGFKMLNLHGIEWVVQNHATVPTADSLQRWRNGEVQPETDLYPVVAPQNLSPKLMEFFNAIDRCTTKKFAILDTMPGRRNDGNVPGGNSIDTVRHPITNLLFLDASRVSESVIAHEFGHAWVQYVDDCEDHRTMQDASNPQRIRQVNFVQSFVLDLKVNDLIRKKGFDMGPIEEDEAASVEQLALALQAGYRPESPREEVFMALLVADQLLQRENGRRNELAKFDRSLESIELFLSPVAALAERMADSVKRHGYDSRSAIETCIDECLLASFDHCGEQFDLDQELVQVKPEEPNIDKAPRWLFGLQPKDKCHAGKFMARNDLDSSWGAKASMMLNEQTRVSFKSQEGELRELILPVRIGPPTGFGGMSEEMAEMLQLKRQNEEGRKNSISNGLAGQRNSKEIVELTERSRSPEPRSIQPQYPKNWPNQPGRPYMAGLGRFLTAARLIEQIAGEHTYGYAFCNPVTYTDPSGLSPGGELVACIQQWEQLGYSGRSACERCKAAEGYQGCFDCNSQSNTGKTVPPWTGPPLPPLINPVWGIGGSYIIAFGPSNYGNVFNFRMGACMSACLGAASMAGMYRNWARQTCESFCSITRTGGCNALWNLCFRQQGYYQKETCLSLFDAACSGE